MPCYHPIPAWRMNSGEITLNRVRRFEAKDDLHLPCGSCIGCRTSRARAWALRCQLELTAHENACWSTLTYEEKYKPPTLQKLHLSAWLKRLRRHATNRIRFFASGEYGEQTKRPHYHAILYGVSLGEASLVQQAWPFGYAQTDPLTTAAIAYVAGYVAKKIGWKELPRGEQVDPDTGEVYNYQPAFIQMSRRPGIGGNARIHTPSWKEFAVQNGHPVPVPRYLHDAWKNTATKEEIEELEWTKEQHIREKFQLTGGLTDTKLMIKEASAIAKQRLAQARRSTI